MLGDGEIEHERIAIDAHVERLIEENTRDRLERVEIVDLQVPLARAKLDHEQFVHVDRAVVGEAKQVGEEIESRICVRRGGVSRVDERLLLGLLLAGHHGRGGRRVEQEYGREIVVAVARVPALQVGHSLRGHERFGFRVDQRDFVRFDRQQAFHLFECDHARVGVCLVDDFFHREENATETVEVATNLDVLLFELELVVVVARFGEFILLHLFYKNNL